MSTFRLTKSTLSLRLPLRTSRPHTFPFRALTTTPSRLYASKVSQDKDSLNPVSTEYSKSGGDNASAHSDEAFDPSKTTPEEQKSSNEASDGSSPLNVSPANQGTGGGKPGEGNQEMGSGGGTRSSSEKKGERRQSSGQGGVKKEGGIMGSGGGGGGSGQAA